MTHLQLVKNILFLVWGSNRKIQTLVALSLIIVYTSSVGLVFVPLILKHIVDVLSKSVQPNNLIIILLFSYGMSWTIFEVMTMLRVQLTFKAINKILTDMISHLIDKYIDLDFISHANKRTGEIIAIVDRLQASLPLFLDGLFVQIIPIVAQIILAVSIVYKSFNLYYSCTLFIIIILYLCVTIITANRTIKYQVASNEEQNKFSNYFIDTLQHYDTIKYFSNEAYEKLKIQEFLSKKEKSQINMYQQLSWIGVLQIALVGCGLILITVKSGLDVLNHKIGIGGFVLLNSYMLQFSLPLSYFGFVIQGIKRTYVDIVEFVELLNNTPFSKVELDIVGIPAKPDIEFIDVSYGYNNNILILKNISLKIKYGEKVAILGKTGAGKSTIIKLLLKFITPSSGQILVGGIDILNIPQHQLIKKLGIVPQDCALFNRNLFDNIKYGNLNADQAEVINLIKLLKLEHLTENITLGERSAKISGGEKQRIAIARVLLKKPQICIFDEFTSSLDANTEQQILALVDNLFANMTVITIAHKFHIITNADKIIFMKNGMIQDIDSHDKLLLKNKDYKHNWELQNH